MLALIGHVGAASAQRGEKVSVLPVPEIEKDKAGEVDLRFIAVDTEADGSSGSQLMLAERYVPLHDSSAVAARLIPEAALERFRSDPNYQYDRVETGGPSLWELFWRWVDEALFRPIRENTSQQFWSWFWLLAGTLVIAFLIMKALSVESGWFFRRKDASVGSEGFLLMDTEDIAAIDLDALLASALGEGRYRDAARLHYLQALQRLTAEGVIDWDKHKTNSQYLLEVRGAGRPALERPFADITSLFEWIWYGEFPVDQRRFALVRERFDRFAEALGGSRS